MRTNFFFFGFLSFLVISLIVSSSAQEQKVQQIEPEQEEFVTYKVSEIPIKLEETSAYLTELYDNVLSPDEVENLENIFDELLKSYSLLRAQTDSVDLDNQLTTTLKEFQQKWNFQKKEISDWSDELTSKTEKLTEQKETLLGNRDIWQRTDTLMREEKADINIRNKITDILTEFNKAEKVTLDEINKSLTLQTKLSEEIVDVDLTIRNIEDLLLAKKREIFVQNAPPIWESLTGKADTASISKQVKDIWDSYVRTTQEFYKENKESFVSSIIYFLILLTFILLLKFFSKNLKSDDPKVKKALKILKAPISASILISILALAIIYTDAPEIFFSLMRIIIVFPLLIVLNKLINPSLRVPLYLFASLLILQQFKLTSASDTEIERILLLVINVIVLGGLIWMLASGRFDGVFTKQSQETKAKVLTKIIIGLFIITLLANMLGYVMLSLTLVNGTINNIFAIIIVLTAALAIQGIIIIFLNTKLAASLNVVKNYPEKIEKVLIKILKLIVVAWATIIILKNFGIREIVFNWLEETVSKEWIIGSFSISLGHILLFFVSIWLSLIIARFIRFILEGDVLPRLNLARGVPGAISTISSYLIIGFGILVAIMSAGIDLNSFALLAGALGIGIGFGLQDIVKNFISGLILIFERPIQVGDAVQVEELSGKVKQIGVRSSTIKTWEGAEVIVPNGNLISNKLINWTLSDQMRRIDVKVGVAYGIDVDQVKETLLKCAKQNDKLLTFPAPSVLFNEFGDSSLDFELRCWTSDFASWVEIRSDIRSAIYKAFREKNIEIPFPQRDLHIKSDFNLPEIKSIGDG